MNILINIPAIVLANGMGIAILYSVAMGNFWRLKNPDREDKILAFMVVVGVLACIADPLCFLADGMPGKLNHGLVIGCNTFLYLANIFMTAAWHALVTTHLGIRPRKGYQLLLAVAGTGLGGLLVVNLFTPVVFSVVDNVYQRTNAFWVFMTVQLCITADGFRLYFRARRKSGGLKLFPVWAFTVPAFVGLAIQSVFYGISTLFPFYSISIACIAGGLQNEYLFRDRLTGLYNRFYLSKLVTALAHQTGHTYVAMMLDINRFKTINDTYGHREGDQALVRTAAVLRQVIGDSGTVIRYAGDEFIVLLRRQDEGHTERVIQEIHAELSALKQRDGLPYDLSVAVGYCRLRQQEETIDEFLDRIDKQMYQDKQRCHRSSTD